MEAVRAWLESVGLSAYGNAFEREVRLPQWSVREGESGLCGSGWCKLIILSYVRLAVICMEEAAVHIGCLSVICMAGVR